MTKIGVLDGEVSTYVRRKTHLKSMGNTVSAHIYEIKVFRLYPVILYRLRLDHSIHWWKIIDVPRNTKIGILDGKASIHVRRNAHLKSREILFLLISTKLRSLDPTLLYCIDSN